eukprot:gb/GECG01001199.1/.p1 GENE.gb/GECG01001199.1/~~gb/GECG01001199.1/.p1  ORF type:complete len:100 (+),score=9.11 gb/GECG01001199.1/:1-300(+)
MCLSYMSFVLYKLRGKNTHVTQHLPTQRTPLHLASFKGNVDCIKLLVSSGSQVNAEAQDGITPLQFAVQSGNLEAAKELLLSGANVDCKVSFDFGFICE